MPLIDAQRPAAVAEAARALAEGELVAFPTETVYGLGARADRDAAVAAVYAAKGRPRGHPLIVHVADAESARAWAARWPDAAQRLTAAFWPGPLTVIVPRAAGQAEAASGGHPGIGLRCPAHPVALALLREAAGLGVSGIAAPSANRFGRISPTRAAHVADEFGPMLRVLDGGACAVGIESAIVDCSVDPPVLLRPGQLGRAALEAALGQPLGRPGPRAAAAPGTLASHYAPCARLRLFDAVSLQRAWAARRNDAAGGPASQAVAVYSRARPEGLPSASPAGWVEAASWRAMPEDPEQAAHDLFGDLRALDASGVSEIWVESPPADEAWEGVRDRLARAAATGD